MEIDPAIDLPEGLATRLRPGRDARAAVPTGPAFPAHGPGPVELLSTSCRG